jgi:hypothetical protein
MNQHPSSKRFCLGQTVITRGALAELAPADVLTGLFRHSRCDWGDCCPDDKERNDFALEEGTRLFSVYHDQNGKKFWIITEADRSATTILLPEEY